VKFVPLAAGPADHAVLLAVLAAGVGPGQVAVPLGDDRVVWPRCKGRQTWGWLGHFSPGRGLSFQSRMFPSVLMMSCFRFLMSLENFATCFPTWSL